MVDSVHNIGLLWLREPNLKKDALAALDTLLPGGYANFSRTHPDSVAIKRVRWDYAELYDWMNYLQSAMRDLHGVEITGWSIDALGGRLVFGMQSVKCCLPWRVGLWANTFHVIWLR
jgi:hypothetical protein